jgi:protein SCO1/2
MALPDFLLVDQDGAVFNKASFEGRFSLVFFGFTHCPDICPATLQQLSVVRTRMVEAGIEAPDVVLISVDPKRDTPAALKQYVGHFGEGFIGVSGDLPELRQLTGRLGIYFEYADGEGDNYNVNHSVVVIVVNKQAEFQAVFSAPHDIDKIVNDVQVLMAM